MISEVQRQWLEDIKTHSEIMANTNDRLIKILREDPPHSRWRPTRKLPVFSGTKIEDPQNFLQRTEEILSSYQTHEEDYLSLVIDQLQGPAQEWAVPLFNLGITWTRFKKEFINKFNGALQQTELRTTFFGREQQGETANIFVQTKYSLWLRMATIEGQISEQSAVQTVIELLEAHYRIPLRGCPPTTFEHLIDQVTILDRDITATHSQRPNPVKTKYEIPAKRIPSKEPYCKYCGQYHLYKDCPTLKKQNQEKRNNHPGNYPRAGTSTQP